MQLAGGLGVGLLQLLVQGEAVLQCGPQVAHLGLGPVLLVGHQDGRFNCLQHLTDLTKRRPLLEVWVPLDRGGWKEGGRGVAGEREV